MLLVERRQLTRGYFDYTFSELYDKHKRTNKKQNVIKENKDVMLKSDLSKEDLKAIKMRIKRYSNLGNGQALTEGVS